MVNSDCSQQSENRLTALFQLLNGKISEVVLHTVVPELPVCTYLESYPYDVGHIIEKDTKYCMQLNMLKVRELEARHPEVHIVSEVSYGKLGFETVKTCMRFNPDLIVTGTRNTNLLDELFKEDDLQYITKHCVKPILLVK